MTPDLRQSVDSRAAISASRVSVRLFRRIAASRWAKPLVRALSIFAALIVLVAIGSSARAIPQLPTTAPLSSASAAVATAPSSASTTATTATTLPITVITPLGAAPPTSVEHAKRATADDPVSLNTASLDDLERLPGIGPKRANAILDLRTKLGRFRQIEDLMRVKGIGRATLKKLRPIVRLE